MAINDIFDNKKMLEICATQNQANEYAKEVRFWGYSARILRRTVSVAGISKEVFVVVVSPKNKIIKQ